VSSGIGGGSGDGYNSVPDVWHRASGERLVLPWLRLTVDGADTQAEYEQVTVLFADVVH
jgi:hypothetical protein